MTSYPTLREQIAQTIDDFEPALLGTAALQMVADRVLALPEIRRALARDAAIETLGFDAPTNAFERGQNNVADYLRSVGSSPTEPQGFGMGLSADYRPTERRKLTHVPHGWEPEAWWEHVASCSACSERERPTEPPAPLGWVELYEQTPKPAMPECWPRAAGPTEPQGSTP